MISNGLDDINPTPYDGIKFYSSFASNTIYTLEDNGSNDIIVHSPIELEPSYSFTRDYVERQFNLGQWVMGNNINESGFDWVDDINTTDKPYVGLRFIHKNDISDRNPNGFTYTVIGVNEESYTVEWYEGGEDNTYDDTVTTYQNWVSNDRLIFVDDTINESEFDWADVETNPLSNVMFKMKNDDRVFTIEDNGLDRVIVHRPHNLNLQPLKFSREHVNNQLNSGHWIKVNSINESEFDWVKDVPDNTPLTRDNLKKVYE